MSSSKSKKVRTRAPQGRLISTSAISQPAVEDISHLTVLSSFSPRGDYFAFLSLAVDKHRLRVYDTVSGQSVAEHIVESARVSTLSWNIVSFTEVQNTSSDIGTSPTKKKRKKRNSLAAGEAVERNGTEVVILGLSDGTVLFFSPIHGRILRTLSHPTSTAEILSVVVVENRGTSSTIWTSGADGTIRLWNAQKNDILGSWKTDDRIPYSAMAVRPLEEEGRVDVLTAHHGIRLLSTTSDHADFDTKKPINLGSFTGHASSIRNLQWDASQIPSTRFLSLAEADRFLYIWEATEGPLTEGRPMASIPLDSDARNFSLSVSHRSPDKPERQTLLTLSASGKISIYPIPQELPPPASTVRTQHSISTLLPRSTLSVSSKLAASSSKVVDAAFSIEDKDSVRIARIVGGVQPVFDVVKYRGPSGEFIENVTIDDVKFAPDNESNLVASTHRYAESSTLALGSGIELGQDQEMDDLADRNVDGDLDVDLAELSLGQRLTALSGAEVRPTTSDSDDELGPKKTPSGKKTQNEGMIVPANSLTRTLIQALHSSDSRLLETCLAHSDQALIRNTVKRLPPQLAVPLIITCVERLGRGARAANMKGGGGGSSSQRGAGLITWIKTTLAVHSGHLMTIPDLVARLSGLHTTLTSRLALHESLLQLSGRLDMVLSQIEMRSSAAPAPLVPRKGKKPAQKATQVTRYVEGESESEEDEQMDVEIESGDDGGSIEDIELGGESDGGESSNEEDDDEEDEDDDDDDDDEEDEDDDDDESPTMNGFIDDEAEEYSEEDESE